MNAKMSAILVLIAWHGVVSADPPPYKPKIVIPDPIRPIVDAQFVAATEASDEIVSDKELVLGVTVNGDARAYPINMLTGPYREIINDRLGGKSIAATW